MLCDKIACVFCPVNFSLFEKRNRLNKRWLQTGNGKNRSVVSKNKSIDPFDNEIIAVKMLYIIDDKHDPFEHCAPIVMKWGQENPW